MPVFVAAFDPPESDEPGRWFLVGDGTVAIVDDRPAHDGAHFLGILDGAACWAVDVRAIGAADVHVDVHFDNLHSLYGRVHEVEWTVAGRAVQLVEWARTHRFCGRCGTPTEPADGERAMRCPACGLLAFPRLARSEERRVGKGGRRR